MPPLREERGPDKYGLTRPLRACESRVTGETLRSSRTGPNSPLRLPLTGRRVSWLETDPSRLHRWPLVNVTAGHNGWTGQHPGGVGESTADLCELNSVQRVSGLILASTRSVSHCDDSVSGWTVTRVPPPFGEASGPYGNPSASKRLVHGPRCTSLTRGGSNTGSTQAELSSHACPISRTGRDAMETDAVSSP